MVALSYFKSSWGSLAGPGLWLRTNDLQPRSIKSLLGRMQHILTSTCSPSLSPSFSPSCLLISTLSSGPVDLDLVQLRNTGVETPHDSSRIWFWHYISDTWLLKHSELYIWWNINIQYTGGLELACIIKQLSRHEPHEDRDEWLSLMTAEESSSWSYWRPEWQVESLGFPTLHAKLQKPRSYYKIIPYWSSFDVLNSAC